MTVKVEAFNALYESLDQKLRRLWEPIAQETAEKVQALLAQDKKAEAEELAHSLNLSTIAGRVEPYLRFHTYASLYYGASRLSPNIKKAFTRKAVDPQVVDRIVSTAVQAVANNATRMVKIKLLEAITAHGKKDQPVFKAESFVKEFVSFKRTGDSMLQLISQLHTSRVSAYGYTIEAELMGVTEYAVTEQLDNRICPVCREMHGKVFRVEDASRALDTILYVDNPDDLKTLQPWPNQSKAGVDELRSLTTEQLVARNWHIPPYHPNCRGILVAKDNVPSIEETPSYQAAFGLPNKDFNLSALTAQRFGMAANDEDLDFWNSKVGYDPRKIMGAVSGLSGVEIAKAIDADLLKISTVGSRVKVSYAGDVAGIGAMGALELEFNPVTRLMTFATITPDVETSKAALKKMIPWMIDMGVYSVALPPALATALGLPIPVAFGTLAASLS